MLSLAARNTTILTQKTLSYAFVVRHIHMYFLNVATDTTESSHSAPCSDMGGHRLEGAESLVENNPSKMKLPYDEIGLVYLVSS